MAFFKLPVSINSFLSFSYGGALRAQRYKIDNSFKSTAEHFVFLIVVEQSKSKAFIFQSGFLSWSKNYSRYLKMMEMVFFRILIDVL